MVEKFNWTLGQELAKYCAGGQTEWDQKPPALLMAYRSAVHESTGYTPAKLMLGHELRLPVDLLTRRPPDDELPDETTSYIRGLQERLTEVHHQGHQKVVHVNRLWQYHGPGQYTWEDSEEQPPTTDEDQTGDPGRAQDRT
ncbi:uncharacterized protein LOC121875366, partial [Homarus americanus]|uniref:uncharacterized protein LOC121875366 n=1 Tax=Homarus americanus TaxID=6706 RepID=UPI001C47DAE7